MSLPPGQRAIAGFPRFGTHLHRPAPPVPAEVRLRISGAVREEMTLGPADLAALPHEQVTADFHCVAGWSATGLRWGGIPFAAFHRDVIAPALAGAPATHLVLRGLDGWRSSVRIEDALGDDVLIADQLDGEPLDADHGAPLRFVSPSQYGYISVKHLCEIVVHTSEPRGVYSRPSMILLQPHPRARVWAEERHRLLPAWMLRDLYRRVLLPPLMILTERGSQSRDRPAP